VQSLFDNVRRVDAMHLLLCDKDVSLGDWNRGKSDIGRRPLSRTSGVGSSLLGLLLRILSWRAAKERSAAPVISANAKPIEAKRADVLIRLSAPDDS